MALGDMLTGSSGAGFSKGLTVAVPQDKAFYEGVRASQQQALARARAGVSADNQLLKLKVDAAKKLRVDKKLVPEAQAVVDEFMAGIDQTILQYGDAQRAMPHLGSSMATFQNKVTDIEAADALIKAARKAQAQPNALVPEPIVGWLADDSKKDFDDDGFMSLPGFNIRSNMSKDNATGAIVMDFPKKIDVSKLDEDFFKDADISYFRDPNNAEFKTNTFKIEGTTFQDIQYTVKKDAIKKRVATSYSVDPEYKANLAFSYYQANRNTPGFKEDIRELERTGKLQEAIIDYRTDQLFAQGITRSDDVQARQPYNMQTTVNVTTGDVPESAVLGDPSMQFSSIEAVQQDRSKKTYNYPALALNYGEDGLNLSGQQGIIDLRTNEPTSIIGSFTAKSTKLELVPIFAKNQSPSGQVVRIAGKVINKDEVRAAVESGNVQFDVFAKVVADEIAKPGNKKEKDAQLLYPAAGFFNQNTSLGTRAQISKSEQNKRMFATLMGVRDLLNDKEIADNKKAVDLFVNYILDPTKNDYMTQLTQMAEQNGMIKRYMRGGKYVSPEEYNSISTGVIPIEKSREIPKSKPATPPKSTETKPKTGKKPENQVGRRVRTNQTLN